MPAAGARYEDDGLCRQHSSKASANVLLTISCHDSAGTWKATVGWEPRTFCNCDHDRTLAWTEVTTTNGEIVQGCGYGATDVIVPIATQTPVRAHSHVFLILDAVEKPGKDDMYFWAGLSLPVSNNMDICDSSTGTQWLTNLPKPDFRPFPYPKPFPYLPLELRNFDLVGHKGCKYSGAQSNTPGSVTCADGYTAYCSLATSGRGYSMVTDCGRTSNQYQAAVECRYHETKVIETAPPIVEVKDPAPDEKHILEVFKEFIPVGAVDVWTSWKGGVRELGQSVACNRDFSVVWRREVPRSYKEYYPEKLEFAIDGHDKCVYSSGNGYTIGSITCDDGYKTTCTAFEDGSPVNCYGLGSETWPYYPLFYCRVGA